MYRDPIHILTPLTVWSLAVLSLYTYRTSRSTLYQVHSHSSRVARIASARELHYAATYRTDPTFDPVSLYRATPVT